MEGIKDFGHLIVVSAMILAASIIPVYGQVQSPCTASMISSFTPCLNFITGSSGNGSTPTPGCCSSLRSLTGSSLDCACLILTGNIPFQIPINRTLAISLPRACNMAGVPVQCKASGSPLPAPGPVSFGPTLSPSPKASVPKSTPPASAAPESDTTSTIVPAPPVDSEAPTTTTDPGIRPVPTPSAAKGSYISSTSVLLFALGVMVLKY